MTSAFEPKDYRLELEAIPMDSSFFQASSVRLLGPREWDEVSLEEHDWACRQFSSMIASYIRVTFREETAYWGCIPRVRQFRDPLDVIGSIFRWFQRKTWKIGNESQIEATVLESCTRFVPDIFVGIDSSAPRRVRRGILDECYFSKTPTEAIASIGDLPLKFLLAPAIEDIEVELVLRMDVHAQLEKALANAFKGSVVRP